MIAVRVVPDGDLRWNASVKATPGGISV